MCIKIRILTVLSLLLPSILFAEERFCYRVYLKDKGSSVYSLDHPENFLSKEAIERRLRQGLAVSISDLPIAQAYLDTLTAYDCDLILKSKWFSTVVVSTSDSSLLKTLSLVSFVDSVKLVWKGDDNIFIPLEEEVERLKSKEEPKHSLYGYAEKQIQMLNGIKLHQKGFKGEGMRVAIIDAGFKNVDRIAAFDSLRLLGTHNVISPHQSVFVGDNHGTKVLSCLAANEPGIMVGTAPSASYWLIKSEDTYSEYPIEEDFWTAAIEFADSVGVSVVSSSLGYYSFDDKTLDYNKNQLDGKTSFITRAAQVAASKGLVIFCSAGNEGASGWRKITFPADASDVLTVGAITDHKKRSEFSSIGFTVDERVKPDLVALGSGCCVIDSDGDIHYVSGTSFATPILAGLSICLWQAFPFFTNKELIEFIRHSGSMYDHPNAEIGYGIPNIYKAYKQRRKYEKSK